MMLYNMAAGILRAVGDSKRPFYFLVVSSIFHPLQTNANIALTSIKEVTSSSGNGRWSLVNSTAQKLTL